MKCLTKYENNCIIYKTNKIKGAFLMKSKMLAVNIVLMLVTVFMGIYYTLNGTLAVKGLAAVTFVFIGAVNLCYCLFSRIKPIRFPVFIVSGLVFSMLGDIVLSISFIPGAVLFALGHILYFTAHLTLFVFSVKDLVPSFLLFVPTTVFITVSPIFDFGSSLMLGVCVCYTLIISLMVGKAVSNALKKPSALTFTLLLGSVLFFFSDFMLVLRMFGDIPRIGDWLCLMSYFPAQALLGHSVYRYAKAEKHN